MTGPSWTTNPCHGSATGLERVRSAGAAQAIPFGADASRMEREESEKQRHIEASKIIRKPTRIGRYSKWQDPMPRGAAWTPHVRSSVRWTSVRWTTMRWVGRVGRMATTCRRVTREAD